MAYNLSKSYTISTSGAQNPSDYFSVSTSQYTFDSTNLWSYSSGEYSYSGSYTHFVVFPYYGKTFFSLNSGSNQTINLLDNTWFGNFIFNDWGASSFDWTNRNRTLLLAAFNTTTQNFSWVIPITGTANSRIRQIVLPMTVDYGTSKFTNVTTQPTVYHDTLENYNPTNFPGTYYPTSGATGIPSNFTFLWPNISNYPYFSQGGNQDKWFVRVDTTKYYSNTNSYEITLPSGTYTWSSGISLYPDVFTNYSIDQEGFENQLQNWGYTFTVTTGFPHVGLSSGHLTQSSAGTNGNFQLSSGSMQYSSGTENATESITLSSGNLKRGQ